MANVILNKKPYTKNKNIYSSIGAVTNTPLSLDAVDTPIVFEFESKELNQGEKYSSQILYLGYDLTDPFSPYKTISDGDTYTIFGEVFTAKDNPTNTNQWQAGNFQTYTKAIAESLVSAINSNPNVNYRVTASIITFDSIPSLYAVLVTSRFQGSANNLDITASIANNTQPLGTLITSQDNNRGQRLQGYDYSVYTDVYFIPDRKFATLPKGENELFVTTLSKSYTSDNRFYFDVSELLKPELELFTPEPFTKGGGGTVYNTFEYEPNQIIGYYLGYGEAFKGGYDLATGEPVDDVNNITNTYKRKFSVDTTEVRYATHAAFPAGVNSPLTGDYFFYEGNTSQTLNKGLTNAPEGGVLRRRMQNTPYYFSALFWDDGNETAGGQYPQQYRVYYEHYNVNHQLENTGYTLNSQVPHNGIYCGNLSDEALNLSITDTADQVLYTNWYIQKYHNAQWYNYQTGNTFWWDLNNEIYDNERVYFRNAFGQIESFDFQGFQIHEINVERETYENTDTLEYGNNRTRGRENVINSQVRRVISLESGFVDKETYLWLRELLQSIDVYLLGETSDYAEGENTYQNQRQYLEPYIIEKQSWELSTENDLYNLSLTLKASLPDNSKIR